MNNDSTAITNIKLITPKAGVMLTKAECNVQKALLLSEIKTAAHQQAFSALSFIHKLS